MLCFQRYINRTFWNSWAIFMEANCISYFMRSDFQNLLGINMDGEESIGFPWVVWRQGGFSGSYELSIDGLISNIVVGCLVCFFSGGLFPCMPVDNHYLLKSRSSMVRFSLRTLFVFTFVYSVMIALSFQYPSICSFTRLILLFGYPFFVWRISKRVSVEQRLSLVVICAIAGLILSTILSVAPPRIFFAGMFLQTFVSWVGQGCLIVLVGQRHLVVDYWHKR